MLHISKKWWLFYFKVKLDQNISGVLLHSYAALNQIQCPVQWRQISHFIFDKADINDSWYASEPISW